MGPAMDRALLEFSHTRRTSVGQSRAGWAGNITSRAQLLDRSLSFSGLRNIFSPT